MASVSTAPYQLTMHRRTVCLRSSSRNVPSALVGRFFLGRSPPRLLNAAAPSGLKPAPASRLREACSHLQYSTRNHFRFVTHSCPQVFHRESDSSRDEVTGRAGACTRFPPLQSRSPPGGENKTRLGVDLATGFVPVTPWTIASGIKHWQSLTNVLF